MQIGNFTQDEFGLWHHKKRTMGHVFEAAVDACKTRQKNMFVCYFWWNGTFAPMHHSDTPQILLGRWSEWREKYQTEPSNLLLNLEQLTTS